MEKNLGGQHRDAPLGDECPVQARYREEAESFPRLARSLEASRGMQPGLRAEPQRVDIPCPGEELRAVRERANGPDCSQIAHRDTATEEHPESLGPIDPGAAKVQKLPATHSSENGHLPSQTHYEALVQPNRYTEALEIFEPEHGGLVRSQDPQACLQILEEPDQAAEAVLRSA